MAGKLYWLALCVISVHSTVSVHSSDSFTFLTGTLVSQGNTKEEALGRIPENNVEQVQGKELAKDLKEHVAPEEELHQGTLIKDFAKDPSDTEIAQAIPSKGLIGFLPVTAKRVKGNVLDQDVQIGRYVPNPLKAFVELVRTYEIPDVVEGKIVAGDPADLDVLTESIKGAIDALTIDELLSQRKPLEKNMLKEIEGPTINEESGGNSGSEESGVVNSSEEIETSDNKPRSRSLPLPPGGHCARNPIGPTCNGPYCDNDTCCLLTGYPCPW